MHTRGPDQLQHGSGHNAFRSQVTHCQSVLGDSRELARTLVFCTTTTTGKMCKRRNYLLQVWAGLQHRSWLVFFHVCVARVSQVRRGMWMLQGVR